MGPTFDTTDGVALGEATTVAEGCPVGTVVDVGRALGPGPAVKVGIAGRAGWAVVVGAGTVDWLPEPGAIAVEALVGAGVTGSWAAVVQPTANRIENPIARTKAKRPFVEVN